MRIVFDLPYINLKITVKFTTKQDLYGQLFTQESIQPIHTSFGLEFWREKAVCTLPSMDIFLVYLVKKTDKIMSILSKTKKVSILGKVWTTFLLTGCEICTSKS